MNLYFILLVLLTMCSCSVGGGDGGAPGVPPSPTPVVPTEPGPRAVRLIVVDDMTADLPVGTWTLPATLPALSGDVGSASIALTVAPYRYCWRGTGPGGRSFRYVGKFPIDGQLCGTSVSPVGKVPDAIAAGVRTQVQVTMSGCSGTCQVEIYIGRVST